MPVLYSKLYLIIINVNVNHFISLYAVFKLELDFTFFLTDDFHFQLINKCTIVSFT